MVIGKIIKFLSFMILRQLAKEYYSIQTEITILVILIMINFVDKELSVYMITQIYMKVNGWIIKKMVLERKLGMMDKYMKAVLLMIKNMVRSLVLYFSCFLGGFH